MKAKVRLVRRREVKAGQTAAGEGGGSGGGAQEVVGWR